MANDPQRDTGGAGRRPLPAAVLAERFRGLPAVDPDRLRSDVDAVIDQRLPENGHPAER